MGRPSKAKVRGEHAWAVMAVAIVAYEVACHEDELLSVAVDRWLVSRPVLTRLCVAAVSLHLLNLLPWFADPLGKRLWNSLFRVLRSRRSGAAFGVAHLTGVVNRGAGIT